MMIFFLLALFVFLTSFIFWKKAVIFVMYWILVVGAVRKWLLPELSDFLFFSPHFILAGVYLRFLGERVIGRYLVIKKSLINVLIVFLVLWGLLSVFNPQLPSFKVGIIGIIIHFYFIPLVFIVPNIFYQKEDLMSFLKRYSLFSLPLLILGIIQFFSPRYSPINQYVVKTAHIAISGGYARITSTFSYISGYTAYLSLLILILIFLISIRKLSIKQNIVLYILMALTIINLFMTGSRWPVGISIISIILYFLISLRLGAIFTKKFLSKLVIALCIILLLAFSTHIGREAYGGFMQRGRYTKDITLRIIDTFTPFKFVNDTGLLAGLVGYGIGSTYQGLGRFNFDWGNMPKDFEEEPERIVLELGFVGYLLVYSLRLLFLIYFWKLFKRLQDIDLKLLALCSLIFHFQYFHLFSNLAFNQTSGLFYWFFASFVFLLPKLDHGEVNFEKK